MSATDLPTESIESLRQLVVDKQLTIDLWLRVIRSQAEMLVAAEAVIDRVRAVADSILREAASFGIRAIAEEFLHAIDGPPAESES